MTEPSDLKIQKDVLAELAFEPQVDAAAIGVAVQDGVVTLSGHVPALAQKTAAEAAARRVKGVRAIAQEIDVRLPDDLGQTDDTIAARAVDILGWSALPQVSTIHVSVEDGWISLAGHVEWAYQRDEAERALRGLAGVRGIRNEIAVTPHATPEDVEEHIARAFHRNAELERSQVKVDVDGSKVTLKGRVKTWYEQDMAERAAWSTPGVTSVVDEIEIG
ncbi:MAG: BON domain-containing protein [Phenylobacterium sp.]|uniref:BON domain-containing protein n=1 Tax=Phenylobacterium sp. TaxID=1871053 RepID=UPI00121FBCEF|nr:BON domain-containing protein [Phenylobacterium sp.]TAJ73919.1 MAG: BON domain-containing protein [Phenylobacterium sp.]